MHTVSKLVLGMMDRLQLESVVGDAETEIVLPP